MSLTKIWDDQFKQGFWLPQISFDSWLTLLVLGLWWSRISWLECMTEEAICFMASVSISLQGCALNDQFPPTRSRLLQVLPTLNSRLVTKLSIDGLWETHIIDGVTCSTDASRPDLSLRNDQNAQGTGGFGMAELLGRPLFCEKWCIHICVLLVAMLPGQSPCRWSCPGPG